MVTASYDKTLCLWDLMKGVLLKKIEGHHSEVWALAVPRDGQFIVSGSKKGELITWHGGSNGLFRHTIAKAHESRIFSLDFSPDSTTLATGSWDEKTKLWSTESWQLCGDPINCCAAPYKQTVVYCVRYSPSGEYLAIATENDIQIWDPCTRTCITTFKAHAAVSEPQEGGETAYNNTLQWTPDGKRLLSGGSHVDPTIREWDSSTWQQVGDPWEDYDASGARMSRISEIAINNTGTLVASSSDDSYVRLWELSERSTVALFKHSNAVFCVTFSADSKHVLSGGVDKKISEWEVPQRYVLEDERVPQQGRDAEPSDSATHTIIRAACLKGDLRAAEALLTREIIASPNNYTSYANRSFVMAQKLDWDSALRDAIKSITIQPSLTGFISKGISLCGKKRIREAMTAFDIASTFTNGDSKTNLLIFLIKSIALFSANEHRDAIMRIKELASTSSSDVDPIPCCIVEAYLRVQAGIIALNCKRYNEAIDQFTAAVNASKFFVKIEIHSKYEVFTELFGWDLKSLWQTTIQQRCLALLRANRHGEALEFFHSVMEKSDEITKASLRAWFSAPK